ncbi:MAG: trigger factor, partial [Phycisphaerae bacterium]|nr:trigger factor [Phycisphaerae bacterium]
QAQTEIEATEQETAAEQIQIDVEDAGTLRKKVIVTVPADRIAAKQSEMFGELSRTAQVPGFRIGRAPRRLIEKRFGKDVVQDVRNAIIGESLGQAIEKSELNTLGEPDLDLDKIQLPEAGDMTYDFQVEVKPEFDLPELEGIEVEKQTVKVDDARIDETLEQWRQANVRYEDTDSSAKGGDMVVASATISGEGIEQVTKPGLSLRAAPGQIEGLPLVDLGDALTGKKPDQSATLKVTVPEAHPNEQWRGKELTVTIAISQIRRRIVPDLDDQFASTHGFETIDQLRGQVRRSLESRADLDTHRAMRDQICQYLLGNTHFELPETLIARHTGEVLKRRAIDLLQRGVPREQIEENLTELQTAASEEAQSGLKLSFILSKIAEENKIEIGPEEVNSRIAEMARQYNRRPERLRAELSQDGTLSQVESAIREEKALDKLLEQAKVKEKEKPPARTEKKTKKKKQKSPKAKKSKKTKPKADKPAKVSKKKKQ